MFTVHGNVHRGVYTETLIKPDYFANVNYVNLICIYKKNITNITRIYPYTRYISIHVHVREAVVYERSGVGMDDKIKMIQCRLAGAFAEVYDVSGAWYPINSVLETASCSCEKFGDIENARKQLAIETMTINGLECWR